MFRGFLRGGKGRGGLDWAQFDDTSNIHGAQLVGCRRSATDADSLDLTQFLAAKSPEWLPYIWISHIQAFLVRVLPKNGLPVVGCCFEAKSSNVCANGDCREAGGIGYLVVCLILIFLVAKTRKSRLLKATVCERDSVGAQNSRAIFVQHTTTGMNRTLHTKKQMCTHSKRAESPNTQRHHHPST